MNPGNDKVGLHPSMAKTITGTGQGSMKVVRGPAGGMLVLYESGGALVFEWGGTKSELRSYPDDWRKLRDDELLKLHRLAAST